MFQIMIRYISELARNQQYRKHRPVTATGSWLWSRSQVGIIAISSENATGRAGGHERIGMPDTNTRDPASATPAACSAEMNAVAIGIG